ncbi:E3 ubiquitin-protein ligase TRIM33-like [Diadema antillarum]|uniref:E3 ubiquitin-protein ligase TRIM33-like n=1 Tax=Diadema antillarum TaxID=105358 RepID=UPI003A8ACAC9
MTTLDLHRTRGLPSVDIVDSPFDDAHESEDEYGFRRLFELQIKCSMCSDSENAVSFCRDCNEYMCDLCLAGHKRMSKVFARHFLIEFGAKTSTGVMDGLKVEKCKDHRTENSDMYCCTCKMFVCRTCVLSSHEGPDHVFNDRREFQRELMEKVNKLLTEATDKKRGIERLISQIEKERNCVRDFYDKTRCDIFHAYKELMSRLEKRRDTLFDTLLQSQNDFDLKLDFIKGDLIETSHRLASSSKLVEHGKQSAQDEASYRVHCYFYNQLQTILEHDAILPSSRETVTSVSFIAKNVEFERSLDGLEIGKIVTVRSKPTSNLPDQLTDRKQISRYDEPKSEFVSKVEMEPTPNLQSELDVKWSKLDISDCSAYVIALPYHDPTSLSVLSSGCIVVGFWSNQALGIYESCEYVPFLPAISRAGVTRLSVMNDGRVIIVDKDGQVRLYNFDGNPSEAQFVIPSKAWALDADSTNNIYVGEMKDCHLYGRNAISIRAEVNDNSKDVIDL